MFARAHLAPVSPMRSRRNRRRGRSGVTAVESVFTLSILLLVLFAVFDFGLAAFQYNTLAAVARRVARAASLRGSAAASETSTWGPAEYVGTAGDNSEIAEAVAPLLAAMSPTEVSIDVIWPDGSNRENDRVQVHLSYVHHSWVPFLPACGNLNLQAESVAPIVH